MKKINKKLISIIASSSIVTAVALAFIITSFKSDAASNNSSTRTIRSHVKSENDDISSGEMEYSDFIKYDFGDMGSSETVGIETKVKENIKKKNLLVNGKDSENVVIGIFGDGYTKNEQDIFNNTVKELVEYIKSEEPFNKMKDKMNIYSANINSNESGVATYPTDEHDTFFKVSYNHGGSSRIMKPASCAQTKRVSNEIFGECDATIIIANDSRYGGTAYLGPNVIVVPQHEEFRDIAFHEMGHILGELADEYWTSDSGAWEAPNMTQDKDSPPWKDLIGVDGVGV